ncbi:MAG: class I SAM-dependent methyltransferase [Nitrospirales bacterium]|nr:class I SAM-dependent methyltransferase [Nitrospirales bacterium]
MRICPSYLSFILYNPIRKALTNREKVLDEAGITESSIVLEVGAGNGFLTEALARRARKVYAVELQAGMIRKLRKRMGKCGDTVVIIMADIAQYAPAEGFADAALLYFSFHEVSDQEEAAARIGKAVRKGGILSIYEPTLEVDTAALQRSLGVFERAGFQRVAERAGRFVRFAQMIKR